MAIGNVLVAPESGWNRYDITREEAYGLEFTSDSYYIVNNNYTGDGAYAIKPNGSISFSFKGTAIRLISVYANSQSESMSITVDDTVTVVSTNNSTTTFNVVCYEKLNLKDTTHRVTITNNSTVSTRLFALDAIDLMGKIINPNDRRMIINNPSTNQHYSLAEKTLIQLPDTSDKNMILYGIEAGKEIKLDEAFDKIQYVSTDTQLSTRGKVFKHILNTRDLKSIDIIKKI